MLSQLLNRLICWVNYLTDWVIKSYVSLHTCFTCLKSWFLIIYSIKILIITSSSFFLNTSSLNLFKQKYIIISSFLIVISSDNCLCTVKEINTLNHSLMIFCHYCFFCFCLYIIINNYKKCTECIHCECLCVDVLWETLDRVCDKFKLNIFKTKFKQSWLLFEQTHVVIKLNCFHKMLQQTNDCIKKKILCLLQKLFNKKKFINDSSSKTLSQLLNAMSVNF